jgi:hypothetical protein
MKFVMRFSISAFHVFILYFQYLIIVGITCLLLLFLPYTVQLECNVVHYTMVLGVPYVPSVLLFSTSGKFLSMVCWHFFF